MSQLELKQTNQQHNNIHAPGAPILNKIVGIFVRHGPSQVPQQKVVTSKVFR